MKIKINKKIILEEAKKKEKESNIGTIGAVGAGGTAIAAKTGALGKAAAAASKLKGAGLALKAAKSGGALYMPDQDWKKAALYSGLTSAGGTALVNGIGMAMGSGIPAGAIGITSGMAGLQGAALGGGMSALKMRDTLTNSILAPAAVVGAGSLATNAALDAAGYGNIEVNPLISMGLTGAANGLAWYFRNQDKKKKEYI